MQKSNFLFRKVFLCEVIGGFDLSPYIDKIVKLDCEYIEERESPYIQNFVKYKATLLTENEVSREDLQRAFDDNDCLLGEIEKDDIVWVERL